MTAADGTPSVTSLERTVWRSIVDGPSFTALRRGFDDLAGKAQEAGDIDASAACRILMKICSLRLAEEQLHDPYLPGMQTFNSRTFLPDDLSATDLNFMSDLLAIIPDSIVQARVGDILWVRRFGSTPYLTAIAAVDAWLRAPTTQQKWTPDLHQNWARFLRLARQLRLTEQMARARVVLETAFGTARGRSALDLAELLLDTGSIDDASRRMVADRLAELAAGSDVDFLARQLRRAAARLYQRVKDEDAAADQLHAVVRGWIAEAEARGVDSAGAANVLYYYALHEYREIPGAQRRRLDIAELGDELAERIRASGVAALQEMSTLTIGEVDLSTTAAASKDFVRGHDAEHAMLRFIGLAQYLSEEEERQHSREYLAGSVLMDLMPTRHFVDGGRVVHQSGGDAEGPWGYPAKVWDAMIQSFEIHVKTITQGRIVPAMAVLVNEHALGVRDFLVVAEESTVVPRDRANTVARALAAGYNYDFTAALYMLVPQVENIVRIGLRQAGALTTTISDGIEQEVGLSALLERPQIMEVFDSDIVFELRALFGGPTGANLRNAVAHGLVSDGSALSVYSVYAWWFLLRLVYAPYWHDLRAQREGAEEADDSQPAEG